MTSQPAFLRRPESNIPFYGSNTANEAFGASQSFSENGVTFSLTSSQGLRNEEPSRSATHNEARILGKENASTYEPGDFDSPPPIPPRPRKPVETNALEEARLATTQKITLLSGVVLEVSYQEHMCSEDFYRQPAAVYESVAVLESSTGRTHQESSVNETNSNLAGKYVVENEVSWNSGTETSEHMAVSRYESAAMEEPYLSVIPNQPARAEVPSLLDTEIEMLAPRSLTKLEKDLRELDARVADVTNLLATNASLRDVGSSAKHTTDTFLAVNIEAEGRAIQQAIQSIAGCDVLFNLYRLEDEAIGAKRFFLTVLEQYISERPSLWKGVLPEGFDYERYKESDDDLFLQLSHFDSALDLLSKTSFDYERVQRQLKKARDIQEKRLPLLMKKQDKSQLRLEAIGFEEIRICMRYATIRAGSIVKNEENPYYISPWGARWSLQLEYLCCMGEEPPGRYDKMMNIPWKSYERSLLQDIEMLETLRYGVDILIDSPDQLPMWQDYAAQIPVKLLYRLAEVGHKEIVLENLRSIYTLDDRGSGHLLDEDIPHRTVGLAITDSRRLEKQPTTSSNPNKPTLGGSQAKYTSSAPSIPINFKPPRPSGLAEFIGRLVVKPKPEPLQPDPPPPPPELLQKFQPIEMTDGITIARPIEQSAKMYDHCTHSEKNHLEEFDKATMNSSKLELDGFVTIIAKLGLINTYEGLVTEASWTPLDACIKNHRFEAAKALVNLGAVYWLSSPLHTAIHSHVKYFSRSQHKNLEDSGIFGLIMLMLDTWTDMDINQFGTIRPGAVVKLAPLHIAAMHMDPRSIKLLRILVERGARVDLENSAGATPLGMAKIHSNGAGIRFLEGIMAERGITKSVPYQERMGVSHLTLDKKYYT